MSALIVFKVALVVFLAAGIGVLVVVGIHRSRANRADPRWRQPHHGQPGHLASIRGIMPKTPTPQTDTHNHHDTNPPPRHPPRPQGDVRPTTPE